MRITVKVAPRSGANSITQVSEDSYEVKVKEPAENNRANIAVAKMLAKKFGTAPRLVAGASSHKKIFEIQ